MPITYIQWADLSICRSHSDTVALCGMYAVYAVHLCTMLPMKILNLSLWQFLVAAISVALALNIMYVISVSIALLS